jgi:N-carbamoyl-L-amino-acid hydrolase
VKAAPIFTLIPQWVKAQNSQMVGTVGQVILEPGATNVVPGKCRFVVELRSMNPEDMLRVRNLLTEWVEIHPGCSIKTIYEKESVRLSEDMIDLIAGAAEIENLACVRMASGAGHDSQSLAPYMPTGMIFIPCKAGKSHVPEEWTEPHQIGNGCRALMRALLELAKHENHGRSVKIPI